MSESLPITHQPEETGGSFLLQRDGARVGELTYSMAGDLMIIGHTHVDGSLRGQGAGKRLVAEAVAWARRERKRIQPLCPYAKAEIARTPAFQDVLA